MRSELDTPLFQEFVKKRVKRVNWHWNKWDYTEWEEALEEFKSYKKT